MRNQDLRSGVPAGEREAVDVLNERRRVARARLTGRTFTGVEVRGTDASSWVPMLETATVDELAHQIGLRLGAPAGSPAAEARAMFAQELEDRLGREGRYRAAIVDEDPYVLRDFVQRAGHALSAAAAAELERRGLEVSAGDVHG